MKLLWITWKDTGHPEAGGAETVCHQLCQRLLAEGHEVTLLTTNYPGAASQSAASGVKTIRVGSSRYLHPFQALWYYVRHLRNAYDVVIEEINGGAPYFSVFFGRKSQRFLLYHQLGRKNWFYEIKAPFSYLGYHLLVPIATRIMSWARVPVITVSESTRQALQKHGFAPDRTHIISEGLVTEPLADISKIQKYRQPTILSHGRMRAMKRTLDQIKAFELAKKMLPELRLKVSGDSSGEYGKKVLAYIAASPYKDDIEYLGRTTDKQREELMQRCHAILVTSIEEGWGLIVTEANSQGTPGVAYDVDGLRDSVRNGHTGIVTAANPAALADGIVALIQDTKTYNAIRHNAWQWSKEITFDRSYQDFKTILEKTA